MIYLFLANGFEEVEALAPLDILRRAGQEIVTVGVSGRTITGSHGIPVVCDRTAEEIAGRLPDVVILPGGMPGTKNLGASSIVCNTVRSVFERGGLVCAICAAPSVLGSLGVLQDRKATCFPGFEQALLGADVSADSVVRDDNVITAKGAGVALEFGFAITAALCGEQKATSLRESMQCK
ncbi:MAG: DJ-1/PfpI family protein [Clostridia bacterium]|nr:DJ-1/PfpI family protein [Clostridia bacterium]